MNPQPFISDLLVRVCALLSEGRMDEAALLIREKWPLGPKEKVKELRLVNQYHHYPKEKWESGQPSPSTSTSVFVRDRFVDGYSGERLVFPGAMLLVSHLLSEVFPYRVNWPPYTCHQIYYKLFATIDHIYPKSRGGGAGSNFLTVSMDMNTMKGSHTPEEVGLKIIPIESREGWDGLLHWFVDYMDAHPYTENIPHKGPGQPITHEKLMQWYTPAVRELPILLQEYPESIVHAD